MAGQQDEAAILTVKDKWNAWRSVQGRRRSPAHPSTARWIHMYLRLGWGFWR